MKKFIAAIILFMAASSFAQAAGVDMAAFNAKAEKLDAAPVAAPAMTAPIVTIPMYGTLTKAKDGTFQPALPKEAELKLVYSFKEGLFPRRTYRNCIVYVPSNLQADMEKLGFVVLRDISVEMRWVSVEWVTISAARERTVNRTREFNAATVEKALDMVQAFENDPIEVFKSEAAKDVIANMMRGRISASLELIAKSGVIGVEDHILYEVK